MSSSSKHSASYILSKPHDNISAILTFTSAVKAAAARKRPFGDIAAMLFFN